MICKKHGDSSISVKRTSRGRSRNYCTACERDRFKRMYSVPLPKLSVQEMVGMTFNHLTLMEPTDRRSRHQILWKVSCVCGNIIFRPSGMVRRGFVKSCGCQTKAMRVTSGRKSRRLDPRISSARSIWGRVYRDGCDFETFLILSQKPCTYCGRHPHRVFNRYDTDKRHPKREGADFVYNGLDRIDNAKDHSPENVVPCCTVCNMMKGTLSVDEFLTHIRLVSLHNQPSV